MPKKKLSNADIAIWVFIVLGALGLYETADWWFEHVILPIGDFISYLEWVLRTGSMNPIEIVVSFIILIVGIYLSGLAIKFILEKIRDFFERLF